MRAKDEARSNCVCQDLSLIRRVHVHGMAVAGVSWTVNMEKLRMSEAMKIARME